MLWCMGSGRVAYYRRKPVMRKHGRHSCVEGILLLVVLVVVVVIRLISVVKIVKILILLHEKARRGLPVPIMN